MNRPALEHIIHAAIGDADMIEMVVLPVTNENTRGATGWCLKIHDLADRLAGGYWR